MNLKSLINGLEHISFLGNLDKKIIDITYNSKESKPDSMFIAIKGYSVDGHRYIQKAIENGAIAIICEDIPEDVKSHVTYIQVYDSRIAQAQIANRFYNYPSNKLNLIGVTGTNGKTSVAFLISEIIKKVFGKVGNIGTLGSYIGDIHYETNNTTPEAIDLQNMLSNMVELKIAYSVMEVSSHSLSLNRIKDTNFTYGIFTNLTQDHLDFHITKENYFNEKSKLFNLTSKANIINGDDPYGEKLIKNLKDKGKVPVFSYGIKNNCDFMAKDINIDSTGVSFTFISENIQERFKLAIPGIFSVYNGMAAIIIGIMENIPIDKIKEALENITAIPGRFEVVNTKRPYSVIIDYAHTPDGLKNVLNTIKLFSKNRIILVFGCGGDRDKTKRPIMGEIGGDYSDFVFITSDNPRNEDPLSIIEDIIPGIQKSKTPYEVVVNRKEAIKKALSFAKKDDIILIAGKGHETYQVLKDKIIPFDEKLIVKELLEEDE